VKIVLDYLGVECMLITGTVIGTLDKPPEPHMWNIVKINGRTYHLDVTFDISQKTGVKRYDYFNLPDCEIERDHTITSNAPRCQTIGRDYYSANSLVFNDYKTMGVHIKRELSNGRKHIVVKLNRQLCWGHNVVGEIIETALQQCKLRFFQNTSVEVSYNPSQYVFEIAFS
jgi:hypothetical protein